MGLLTNEQIQQGKLNYVSIDQATGNFINNHTKFPGIDGDFLGFNTHIYEFKDAEQKKLDIYLKEDETVYQVQFGFYSWMTLGILNCMSNIDSLKNGGKLKLQAFKNGENQVVYVNWNSKTVKWKMQMKDMNFGDKKGTEKEAHRDKVIDRFFELLFEKHPYNPEEAVPAQVDSEPEVKSTDEVPF
jgi:hypothetical protein